MDIARIRESLNVGLLGYGFLRAWIVLYLMVSSQLAEEAPYANAVCLGSVCAGALGLLALRGWNLYRKHEFNFDIMVLGLGVIGASCAHFGSLLPGSAYATLGFAAVGICGGYFEVKWSERFLPYSAVRVNSNLLLAFLLSALVGILSSDLIPVPFVFGESLALLVGMGLCWMSMRTAEAPRIEKDSAYAVAKASRRTLVNLVITTFLFCFAQMAALGICDASVSVSGVYNARFIANLVTAALLVVVFLLRGNLNFVGLLKAILLVTAVGLFLQVLDQAMFNLVPAIILLVGNKLFDVFMLLLLIRLCQEGAIKATLGFALFVASKNIGVLSGKFVGATVLAAIGNDSSLLSLFIGALEVVLIASFLWMFTFKQAGSASPLASAEDPTKRLHAHALAAAAQYGLTARETEILELLARGKNRESIASEQHVSKSTVHTHIIHIYQKTGVHTQQELIALVEDITPDEDHLDQIG